MEARRSVDRVPMTSPTAPDGEAQPGPNPTSFELFVGFARIAVLAFGGVLPWARYVLVDVKGWLTPEEFTDNLALSQLLPGPNIINLSIAIGARFRGPIGSFASIMGLMVLPVAIAICLAAVYAQFARVPAVGGALAGMAAAAAGLIVAMAVKMAEPILRLRFWSAAPFMLAIFIGIGLLRLPLWPVLLALAPLSILACFYQR